MKGTTTHFQQAVVAVLIALAAALVVAWNQAGEIEAGLALDESLVQKQEQLRRLQPIDVAFAADRQAEPTAERPAGQNESLHGFVAPASDLLSYWLVGSASSNGMAATKATFIN